MRFEYRLFDIFLIYGNMKFYEAYSPETLSSSRGYREAVERRGAASKRGKKHDDISSYYMALCAASILSSANQPTPFAFKQAGV